MKKLVLISIFAAMSLSAAAQMHIGGNFTISIDNEYTRRNTGEFSSKENQFEIQLAPKIYWNLSEKWTAGARIGLAYGQYLGSLASEGSTALSGSLDKKPVDSSVNRAIGWSLTPFCGFRILQLGNRVTVWLEGNININQQYNVRNINQPETQWQNVLGYGVQILPVVDIDITEKLALQLHIGILSVGWYGTTYQYQNKTVSTSTWDIRKGGFDGLLQGLMDYGIGLVKTF
ncbi:MAG: hypothetical protein Q4F39_06600 [Bacteroidia bacterium]|nr:hypothetical protein [Bacteroidia bacterium]